MKRSLRLAVVTLSLCSIFLSQGCQESKETKGPAASWQRAIAVRDDRTSGVIKSVTAVNESGRDIPVVYDVDVVVVGGSSAGVAAAAAAAEEGAKVFLAAERPYLGDDICGTYRLWPGQGQEAIMSELAEKVFAEPAGTEQGDMGASSGTRRPPTPMQVKRVLDEALLDRGVEFLYGCYVTDVLVSDRGEIGGVIMANRSGRQAVRAGVIVDATPCAVVARMAGVKFRPFPAGPQEFKRIVVGGEILQGEGVRGREMLSPVIVRGGVGYEAVEYTLEIAMKDGLFASFAKAEQIARDRTWSTAVVDEAEMLFNVPPDSMKAKSSLSGEWPGVRKVGLGVFEPDEIERVWVLGGCADMSRDAAEKMLQPVEYMRLGRRIGRAAASEAARRGKVHDIKLTRTWALDVAPGEVREALAWIRPSQKELGSVRAEGRALPVLGEYDVVVVGGGTGGAPAGIAAARQGAKTLVIEYQYGLGGVGTLGLIGKYYYGRDVGFTTEIDEGVRSFGEGGIDKNGAWDGRWKMQWYRRELRRAGADVWFGALGCGALCEGDNVTGVVVATPQGRGVVRAKVVIDATGNADIAAAAGATCVYTNGHGLAVQGAGLPPRDVGARYTNTDWTFIDDADVIDVWRALVTAKTKYEGQYDLSTFVDTRERRRIVGDYVMSPLDVYLGRTYPDTIVTASSNFDTHGVTIHPMFILKPPDRKTIVTSVPYRCLLPKGLEGMLVTGLGVSAHRDVMPVIRMQADVQNQGYAAGIAAAMAVKSGGGLRDVDIKALQRHLVEKSNLPESVLTDEDRYELPKGAVERAVETVVDDYEGLAVIFARQDEALPLVREAYEGAETGGARFAYARILGILGDATGVKTLIEAVGERDWDKGWNFTGMGQYGACMSELDSLIISLGRTRDRRAVSVIVEKARRLDATKELSHHRAVAMALEALGDPAAAGPIAELLGKAGMTGYAFTEINDARRRTPASATDTKTRNESLRELILARALYRCGDYEGLGRKILEEYSRDLRAHYARHANAVRADPE